MKFNDAGIVTNILYDAWYADQQGRAKNRARIQDHANGIPPWTAEEAEAENFVTNVNFLEMTSMLQSARRQFANGYIKPGRFFTINLDYGPVSKRGDWSRTITNHLNRILKESQPYLEVLRSEFANVVLHGIGPSFWQDRQHFCPEPLGVEDVLIPSGTRLMMDNLPWFGVWRQYTAMELYKKTHGPRVDPGWNLKIVEKCLNWVRDQYLQQPSYAAAFSPEKVSEQFKESLTAYPIDSVPTIDCWCFFYYDDEGKNNGWKQRIVLDNFAGGNGEIADVDKGEWLYDPGDRVYADKRENCIHFSFGDLSAKAPFLYHSVRSLGYLLFAICHLQDRLRCRFNDAVFENMTNYFRVSNPEDAERVQKIDLINKGVLPEGLDFVKAQERWNVNFQLAEGALQMNRDLIGEHSAAYVQDFDLGSKDEAETATKTMQKAQQASAMVGAMLSLSYEYQASQYREICRRFCLKNSRDPDVSKFRLLCLKDGVPEDAIDQTRWNLQVERVLGGGNKAVEIAQSQNLMQTRSLYDPDSQRVILRHWTLAQTDDPALTEMLVPANPLKVTDSVHDAQLAAAALMMGLEVSPREGQNHSEYIEVLLKDFGMLIQKVLQQQQGVANPEQLAGFQNLAQHIQTHIQMLAQQGPEEKARVKQYADILGKIMNYVKAFAQRLQEMQQLQAQQGQQPQIDPKDRAKLQFEIAHNQIKLKAQQAAATQRMQQREQQQKSQLLQRDIEHGMNIRHALREHQANLAKTGMEIQANKLNQPEPANA